MNPSRRKLLQTVLPSALALAATSAIAGTFASQTGVPKGVPQAPTGSDPVGPSRSKFPNIPDPPGPPAPKPDPRAILKQNQETIKRDVKRLAQLARELESELEKTDSTEVLSLQFVRKAEEIEKLAKNIKNLARG